MYMYIYCIYIYIYYIYIIYIYVYINYVIMYVFFEGNINIAAHQTYFTKILEFI